MKQHRWTDEENLILRRDYYGTRASCELIAANIGVRVQQVKSHIQTLGLAKIIRNHWTPEEDEKLAELICTYSPKMVARKLHRSVNSVVVRSKRLNISRRTRDGWYTKKEVCEILGVDHHWIQKRIDSYELKAAPHGELQPQKNGMAMWHINKSDLRDYIIKHAFELSNRHVDLYQVVEILVGINYK